VDPVIRELTNYVMWSLISLGVMSIVVFIGIIFFLWKKIGE